MGRDWLTKFKVTHGKLNHPPIARLVFDSCLRDVLMTLHVKPDAKPLAMKVIFAPFELQNG